MLTQRVNKNKEKHRRRESAAAVFEAYIVRHPPTEQTPVELVKTNNDGNGGGDEGADAGANEVGDIESHVPETEQMVPVESTEVPERELHDGGDGVDDTNEMPELESVDGGDEVVGVNEMPERESDEVGDGVDDANEDDGGVVGDATHVNEADGGNETDETDALLELASVHLSQTNLDAEPEPAVAPESTGKHTDEGDVDMMVEVWLHSHTPLASLRFWVVTGCERCVFSKDEQRNGGE